MRPLSAPRVPAGLSPGAVGTKLVASAGWSVAGDVLAALSTAVAAVVAARLLPRSEIGLVGVVSLLLAFVETVTQSGVEQALVQRAHAVDDVIDSAFTWQLGRGAAIAALLIAISPWVASFYGHAQLGPLCCALALQPLLRGATNLRVLAHVRALEFRALFVLSVLPALLKLATVVVLSVVLRNAWALVAATLAEHALRLALSYAVAPHRPRLVFRWAEVVPLLRYGRWVTGLSVLTYVVTRGDDFFVSKAFDASALAAYQLAYGIANVPATSITHVVGRVSFPAYARLAGDAERLRSAFAEVLSVTMHASLLAAVALYFAFPFLPAVVGAQWFDAVQLGRVFVLGGAVRALLATGGPLFQGSGRPDLDVRMNLPRLLALVLLLAPLSHHFGVLGACLASLASVCVSLPSWWLGVQARAGLRARDLLASLAPACTTAAVASAVLYAASSFTARDLHGLALFTVLGLGGTAAAVWLLERTLGLSLRPSLKRLRAL